MKVLNYKKNVYREYSVQHRIANNVNIQASKGQSHEHLCHTGMPVRIGNHGTDRTTTTKAASVRKQLGTNNSKSNEGRQAGEEWWS